jgi:DNA invertase Pin-like site-specific DNA recombinase
LKVNGLPPMLPVPVPQRSGTFGRNFRDQDRTIGATKGSRQTLTVAEAINGMMLDMLAAIARKDYTDRRRRQAQGIAKAQAEGGMKDRQEDLKLLAAVAAMLKAGHSWGQIVENLKCSKATVAKVAKRLSAGVA